jgi:cardiolipin synthase
MITAIRKAGTKVTGIAVLISALSGCAGHQGQVADEDDHFVASSAERSGNIAERRGAAIAQGGILLARSFPIDPINRPVSNVMSLSSYALKSAAGLLHRVAIGTTQFPALEMQPLPGVTYSTTMDLAQWERDLDAMTGQQNSKGELHFLVDGDEYFDRLETVLSEADDSINIRTYIFDNDDYAVKVADLLKQKSQDVDVRIMVDGLGNLMAQQTDAASMASDFEAPVSIADYLERDSDVRVRTLSNPWMTGDHTKTTIIDRKIAFVGGMNIGREYRYEWHDLMMEVQGPIVDQLQFDTDRAWVRAGFLGDVANFFRFLAGKRHHAEDIGYPVRILYTRNFDSQIYRAQLEAIRRAQSYILIENGYFSDDATLYELARARRRGVDVRVILPEDGNHNTHDLSNAVAINKMLRNGIRVYRYPGMSHIKAAVIDGWASVGSANFDKLSLQVNKEVNLATSHPPAIDELMHKVFIPDLAASEEITEPVEVTLQARLMELVVDEAL